MKKIVWIYGVLAGIISVSWGVLSESVLGDSLSLNTRMILGYATMIVAFSLIFVAIKSYRDNENHGRITFGKAVGIGLLITLIASTVYVVVWMIDFKYFVPDFGEKYQAQAIAEMKQSGLSAPEIQKQSAEMADMMQTYKSNAAYRAMFTYLEVAPVGILMSLLAALILKRKTKPAEAAA
ncbi:DUF4199 domain-containing protein [Mucilaginibacter sp. HD30]